MFETLQKYLTTNFEKELFNESINNLNSNSRIRFSNFSYVMRELLDIVLCRLANDDVVTKAYWYKQENESRKVTRKQRLKYLIQGIYNDFYFTTLLNLNIEERINNLNKFMSSTLSKHTHITEKVFNYSNEQIEKFLLDSESTINNFIIIIDDLKKEISDKLLDFLYDSVEQAFLNETYSDLDILSTHTEVECWDVENISSININNNVISGIISGTVYVNLLYGSDRERRIGDGAEMEDAYPFHTTFFFEIPTADNIFQDLDTTEENIEDLEDEIQEYFKNEIINNINIEEPIIDTSSFYE